MQDHGIRRERDNINNKIKNGSVTLHRTEKWLSEAIKSADQDVIQNIVNGKTDDLSMIYIWAVVGLITNPSSTLGQSQSQNQSQSQSQSQRQNQSLSRSQSQSLSQSLSQSQGLGQGIAETLSLDVFRLSIFKETYQNIILATLALFALRDLKNDEAMSCLSGAFLADKINMTMLVESTSEALKLMISDDDINKFAKKLQQYMLPSDPTNVLMTKRIKEAWHCALQVNFCFVLWCWYQQGS